MLLPELRLWAAGLPTLSTPRSSYESLPSRPPACYAVLAAATLVPSAGVLTISVMRTTRRSGHRSHNMAKRMSGQQPKSVTWKSDSEALQVAERSELERAFDEAAGMGQTFLERAAFVELCQNTLQIDLTPVELERIFDVIVVGEGSKGLSRDRFVQTVQQRFFLRSVRRVLKRCASGLHPLPPGYRLEEDTATNHFKEGEGFHGPFAEIRSSRDHKFHGTYSLERQMWQDSVLETVVQRTSSQPAPWLVFTCGAMGVGKGYALGWMSSQGLFPLEHIVHIDPDHFKRVMPEWHAYIEYSKQHKDPSIPGNRCHRESCYMQELALEESLRRCQNIWVDGSLRNAEWFVRVFEDIRERHPAYRIAIFEITAPEALIRQRAQERTARTGRSIPKELLDDSIKAVERSVLTLMPRADFMASIDNTYSTPRLRYFATLDRSGDWSILEGRFARTLPSPREFPAALAPMLLIRARNCQLHLEGEMECVVDGRGNGQHGKLVFNGHSYSVTLSPALWVTLGTEAREAAQVPSDAVFVTWVYPTKVASPTQAKDQQDASPASDAAVERQLLRLGGFAYWDLSERLVGVSAATKTPGAGRPAMVQFGSAASVSPEEAAAVPPKRWAPVTQRHLRAGGAIRYAFLTPLEKLSGRRISVGSGFLFELSKSPGNGQSQFVFFPIIRRPWAAD